MGQASRLSSTINLLNTIVGAGVLTMPLAISRMGILLGVSMILWSGATAGLGLYLQAHCAQYLERGSASFFALSQLTYPNAAVFFDLAIAIKCFGVAISYLIIIGDLMPDVIRGSTSAEAIAPFLLDRHFWVTAFMLVIIPLSFLRRLDSLKYTSVISLIAIGYLLVLVLYYFFAGNTLPPESDSIRLIQWAGAIPTLSSIPVVIFAYTCHQNMFSVLNEISDISHFNTTSVIGISNCTAATIYILVGVSGYLSFGNDIGGNIIAQYLPSLPITFGRAAIVILVLFSYPLQVHPCRASIDAVLKWRPTSHGKTVSVPPPRTASPSLDAAPLLQHLPGRSSSSSSSSRSHQNRRHDSATITETRFAIITTAIIVCSYLVSITVQSLEAVLAYVGSTGSTSISFILPGLFYYKLSSPDSPHHQRLLKQQDDYYDGDSSDDVMSSSERDNLRHEQETGILNGTTSSTTTITSSNSNDLSSISLQKTSSRHNRRGRRRRILRHLSAALVIYGVGVMIVCLATTTFFVAAH